MRFLDSSNADRVVTVVAVILMLAGAALLIADAGGGIGFPLVAVGIALTAILATERRHRPAP